MYNEHNNAHNVGRPCSNSIGLIYSISCICEASCSCPSMGISWPNSHRVWIPTINTDALDPSQCCSFHARTSNFSYHPHRQDFNRAWHGYHHSSLVYTTDILRVFDWLCPYQPIAAAHHIRQYPRRHRHLIVPQPHPPHKATNSHPAFH